MKGALLGSLDGHPETLKNVVAALEVEGPVALVTAGWQEYESQDEEIQEQLGRPVVNLTLYQRAEQVFADDKEYASEHRARQDLLRLGQEYYRLRVARTLETALDIARRTRGSPLKEHEERLSMEALRLLDRDHLERTASLRREFEERLQPLGRKEIARHREELSKLIESAAIVAIAGGHVAVLLNRLRMFGIPELIRNKVLLAWAGGAMATAEQVVLFHDDPPQGAGASELLEHGLGLHRGVIPLPNPRHRLKLQDPYKVSRQALRYQPARMVALDNGSCVFFDDDRYFNESGTHLLNSDGTVSSKWTRR